MQSSVRGGPSTAWARQTLPGPWAATMPRTRWRGSWQTWCAAWQTTAYWRSSTRRWRMRCPAASTMPCRPLWRPMRTRPLTRPWATRRRPRRCSAETPFCRRWKAAFPAALPARWAALWARSWERCGRRWRRKDRPDSGMDPLRQRRALTALPRGKPWGTNSLSRLRATAPSGREPWERRHKRQSRRR